MDDRPFRIMHEVALRAHEQFLYERMCSGSRRRATAPGYRWRPRRARSLGRGAALASAGPSRGCYAQRAGFSSVGFLSWKPSVDRREVVSSLHACAAQCREGIGGGGVAPGLAWAWARASSSPRVRTHCCVGSKPAKACLKSAAIRLSSSCVDVCSPGAGVGKQFFQSARRGLPSMAATASRPNWRGCLRGLRRMRCSSVSPDGSVAAKKGSGSIRWAATRTPGGNTSNSMP